VDEADQVGPEVVAQGDLWASAAANACLGLGGKAGLQGRNTQAAEDRTAYCNQGPARSCLAEVHTRGQIVEDDSNRRIEVVEDSLVERMGTDHDSGGVGLDLVVVEGQDETRSVDQTSVESSAVHVWYLSTVCW
jgi:hypothetical protein